MINNPKKKNPQAATLVGGDVERSTDVVAASICSLIFYEREYDMFRIPWCEWSQPIVAPADTNPIRTNEKQSIQPGPKENRKDN